jgi:hypothetical protein
LSNFKRLFEIASIKMSLDIASINNSKFFGEGGGCKNENSEQN